LEFVVHNTLPIRLVRRAFGKVNVLETGFPLLALEVINNPVEIVVKIGGKAVPYFSDLFRDGISHRYLRGFQAACR